MGILIRKALPKDAYEKCGFAFDGAKKEINIDALHTHMRYVRSLCTGV